jgi:hypothetical protein
MREDARAYQTKQEGKTVICLAEFRHVVNWYDLYLEYRLTGAKVNEFAVSSVHDRV